MVSQFLNSPYVDHWNVVTCIVKYTKGSSRKSFVVCHNNHTKVVCIQMLIGQKLLLGDPLLNIVPPFGLLEEKEPKCCGKI